MMDRADREASFEFLEGLFDLGELEIVFPHSDRIGVCHVDTEEIAAFPPPCHPQGLAVKTVGEGGGLGFALTMEGDLHSDVAGIASSLFFRLRVHRSNRTKRGPETSPS